MLYTVHRIYLNSVTVFPVNMSRIKLIVRNPAYDGSSEDEEIDPIDLAPLVSCPITSIVTAPAKAEDRAEDGVEDRDEDGAEDGVEDGFEDRDEDGAEDGAEDRDEDDIPPGLVTDDSSSNEYVRLAMEEI